MGIIDYLDETARLFLLSPVVRSFQLREREERLQEGFIRVRAVLSNGDILEAFEFVVTSRTVKKLKHTFPQEFAHRPSPAPHLAFSLALPHRPRA